MPSLPDSVTSIIRRAARRRHPCGPEKALVGARSGRDVYLGHTSTPAEAFSGHDRSMPNNPAQLVADAVDRCLTLAETWLAWDGRPIVTDGANLWTPAKAARRIQDHLVDHLAEVEALLAGATPLPDTWHGRTVTLDSDWSRFAELDLSEARSRWTRLGASYVHRYSAAGPEAWDLPRDPNWTLRLIAEHVAGITWYAEQVGALRFGESASIR